MSVGQVGKSFIGLRKGKEPQTGRIQTLVWRAYCPLSVLPV